MLLTRQTVITFPDNPELEDITDSIKSGTMSCSEILYPNGFTIGECNSNKFEADIYNIPDIVGEKIYVYQTEDDMPDIPIFTGYIDSCKRNKNKPDEPRHIVAYDDLYSKGNMNVAQWWEDLFASSTTATILQARTSLCNYVGIQCETVSLPNDSVTFTQTQQINSITFNQVMKAICEVNGCSCMIDRQGVLRFVIPDTTSIIDIRENYEGQNSEFEPDTTPYIQKVIIESTSSNERAVVGNGTTVVTLKDNLFLLKTKASDLIVIANTILNTISNIRFTEGSIKMILSDWNIKCGSFVQTEQGISLVGESEFKGTLLIEQSLKSTQNKNLIEATHHNVAETSISEGVESSGLKYYRYVNQSAYEIGDLNQNTIIRLRYALSKSTIVVFHGIVLYDVHILDNTQPAKVKVRYKVNSTEIMEYTPEETHYVGDGKHSLALMYFWKPADYDRGEFEVLMEAENCEITIGAYKIEGLLEGMGLVGDETWNGYLDFQETVHRIALDSINVKPFTDTTFNVSTKIPTGDSLTDELGAITLDTDIVTIKGFTEALYFNKYPLHEHYWREIQDMKWSEVEDTYFW